MQWRRLHPITETLPDLGRHVHGLLLTWGGQKGGQTLSAFPLPLCALSLAVQGAASALQFLLGHILGNEDVRKEAR